jgi:sulfur carrier protein
MNVFVNSQPLAISAGSPLETVLEQAGISNAKGIAVAINNVVVPKADWERTSLNENDKIIIIKATQGG